jgi:hypothetical protein
MKKLPVIVAAVCTLAAVPALAQSNSQAPYGERSNRESGMKGGQGERGTYGEAPMRRHGWRAMQEGCKYITVRQRQGDEVTIRHFKRCD